MPFNRQKFFPFGTNFCEEIDLTDLENDKYLY